MAKKVCSICGKKLGILAAKATLSDGGFLCRDCLDSAGISALNNRLNYNADSVQSFFADRISLVNAFSPTKCIGKYLKIDENNRTFMVQKDLFQYKNLLSFELLEDGLSVKKGGVGRAVAGGMLFGGVGAIVGGVTGKTTEVCTSLKIQITLKNAHTDTAKITFVNVETKKTSSYYRLSKENAQQCLAALQLIADENEVEDNIVSTAAQQLSPADEIMKYKNLLDIGVITQQEFDAKKRQLLHIE